jgi:hypothetical protein
VFGYECPNPALRQADCGQLVPSYQVKVMALSGGGTTPQTVSEDFSTAFDVTPRSSVFDGMTFGRPSPTASLHFQVFYDLHPDPGGPIEAAPTDPGGGDVTVTSPAATQAPSVTTAAPVLVKAPNCGDNYNGSQATLKGTVDDHDQLVAEAAFEYGPTTAYGDYQLALGSVGTDPIGEFTGTQAVTGDVSFVDACGRGGPGLFQTKLLTPGKYHYRLVADNGFGSAPSYGADRTFTVPKINNPRALHLLLAADVVSSGNILDQGGYGSDFSFGAPGTFKLTVTTGGTVLASGKVPVKANADTHSLARITVAGRRIFTKALHSMGTISVTETVTFTPRHGKRLTGSRTINV